MSWLNVGVIAFALVAAAGLLRFLWTGIRATAERDQANRSLDAARTRGEVDEDLRGRPDGDLRRRLRGDPS